ncbi:3-oxoacyl-ACP synthase [Photorhabdus luminescens subsp. luminescens]|uniref:3-oxoacyl-[acyl-carrier-protein] synthase-3 n=1 Tax=Photorhabdus luminescens TaxID=29488 RepID=A0A1G5PRI1_PHOLU|nr:3-oxoacyl-ACP synthase III family protein [Photorhabdus luminescens]KMW74711.1 3-oxoacyl-ACP synthase [Photorhabdus luminescens subsp. luminescens]MCW7762861.1 3-oxoacyl-ACP synthase III family protein [Photorhabdus luminescens subsp. venezuelensis]SCZ51956.1 3-oxoacyl-[acyl-carrier-protein] synthase-3 [Photorhabdus luminescens]
MQAVGIQAIAVYLPDGVRTNAWWCEETPPAQDTEPSVITSKPSDSSRRRRLNLYDAAIERYLEDPFFGSVERRVVANNEGSVELGIEAARRVLDAAGVSPNEVDCLISVSMFPDRIGSGDAAYLAQSLGTGGGAFNVEATCGGSMSGLLTACAWVQAGLKERILVVTTSRLSRAIESDDVTLRLCGDASAAFLVGPVDSGFGLLGAESLHTGKTCGTWLLDAVEDISGVTFERQKIRLRVDPSISHVLRATAEEYLVQTTEGALAKAGLELKDIDFVVVNTPTAWHAEFSANVLGIEPDRIVDTFPQVANIGPALMPFNAYTAAAGGHIKPGDTVLLYGFGGQAEASAAIFRWSDVILAPSPKEASVINPTTRSEHL